MCNIQNITFQRSVFRSPWKVGLPPLLKSVIPPYRAFLKLGNPKFRGNRYYDQAFWSHSGFRFDLSVIAWFSFRVFNSTLRGHPEDFSSSYLTLSWGASEMYVGWGGVGKFTHHHFFLKYVPKLHQTWYFGSICDEDQKTKSVNLKSIW